MNFFIRRGAPRRVIAALGAAAPAALAWTPPARACITPPTALDMSCPPVCAEASSPAVSAATTAAGAATVQVDIVAFQFVPSRIEVPANTVVHWTNLDPAEHTATSDSFVFDSGSMGPAQSFEFTFDAVGEYPYFCNVHTDMRGTVAVVAVPEPSRAAGLALAALSLHAARAARRRP